MTNSKQYSNTDFEPRIVGFVCNWGAYSGAEMAGLEGREYPASIRLVKVMCLGRLNLGLLLKAFELGADGVMLLGCPEADCYYDSGMEKTRELFMQARKMLHLLGIEPERLVLVEVPLGRGDILVKQISTFVKRIGRVGSSPLCPSVEAGSQA